MAAKLTLFFVVLALPGTAAAGITASTDAAKVGTTATVRISIVNDRDTAIRAVSVRVPPDATLLAATIDDPTWLASQDGILLDWEATTPLAPGGRLQLDLRFRFEEAGDAATHVRARYADGTTEEATIRTDVTGSSGGLGAEIAIVVVAGAAIFLGAIAVFIVGRRRLRD